MTKREYYFDSSDLIIAFVGFDPCQRFYSLVAAGGRVMIFSRYLNPDKPKPKGHLSQSTRRARSKSKPMVLVLTL